MEGQGLDLQDNIIDQITANRTPHFEPYGWHHWPEQPWFSYQFRRGLGETQEGGGAVSEVFQAASRIIPGDKESWHAEWLTIAERNLRRAGNEEKLGHVRTAMNCYLRASEYFRQAEFFLPPDDPRRLPTFTKMETCSQGFLAHLDPPGEVVQIAYERDIPIYGYFARASHGTGKPPCLICMGGLDSIKDEMWFMQARGALQRGISVLMIDGPGQGGTLRRHGETTRVDYEVPIGRCVDYLETRNDVDLTRVAVCGSSLGGFYAARAACYEHRLAAAISHGAIWSVQEVIGSPREDHGLSAHFKWVFGADSMREVYDRAKDYTLEGHMENMQCPYLVLHGAYDVLAVSQSQKVYDYGRAHNVDVTLRLLTAEETGAEHCQHDNPTIGQEVLCDWLADRFQIDQRRLNGAAQGI
jgi:pimeloyl-ACP methyl ester carboxylesterase